MISPFSTGALLRDVARLHTQLQRLCVSSCEGTTVTQCTVLTELSRGGPMTLAQLSRRIGLDKSWTSRAVERLCQKRGREAHQGTAETEVLQPLARRLSVSLASKLQADQGTLGVALERGLVLS